MKKRFTVGLDPELRQPLMQKVASINLKLSEDSEGFISLHRYVSDVLACDLGVTYEVGVQRVGVQRVGVREADAPPLGGDGCDSGACGGGGDAANLDAPSATSSGAGGGVADESVDDVEF